MQAPLIATLTMNPALDLWATTDRVVAEHKLRCGDPRFDPGGGGINVARAVTRLGGSAVAIYPSGGPNGGVIERLLADEQVPQRIVPVQGWTRESVTIQELATGAQFRFVLPGPSLSEAEQSACLAALAALEPSPAFVVVSGSMPQGVGIDFLTRVLEVCRKHAARPVFDVSGPLLAAIRGAYLIKPSLRELSDLAGAPLETPERQAEAARHFVREGHAETVVVSLGSGGALLATGELSRRFRAPLVEAKSAVGAGDAMVAGIVFSLAGGASLVESVRFGVAAGSAAVLHPGTGLCTRADTESLLAMVGDDDALPALVH
jgi:6-phosphofructokinase 2